MVLRGKGSAEEKAEHLVEKELVKAGFALLEGSLPVC